jgi:hypothetical protein
MTRDYELLATHALCSSYFLRLRLSIEPGTWRYINIWLQLCPHDRSVLHSDLKGTQATWASRVCGHPKAGVTIERWVSNRSTTNSVDISYYNISKPSKKYSVEEEMQTGTLWVRHNSAFFAESTYWPSEILRIFHSFYLESCIWPDEISRWIRQRVCNKFCATLGTSASGTLTIFRQVFREESKRSHRERKNGERGEEWREEHTHHFLWHQGDCS